MCTWAASLADSGLRSSTLSVYTSALHTRHEEEAHPDGDQRNPLDSVQLKRVLKGIANAQLHRPSRHPPSAPLLFSTLLQLPFNESERDRMLFAAAALGISATLRPSELLGSSRHPDRALTLGQIDFFSDSRGTRVFPPHGSPAHLSVRLHCTKTHKKGETKYVSTPRAVAAVWTWIATYRTGAEFLPSEWVFCRGQTKLTSYALTKDMERRHKRAGLGEVHFTGKCFRKGGASTLAAQGIDAADIASLGWAPNSPMWQVYADDPAVKLHRALQLSSRMQVKPPQQTVA